MLENFIYIKQKSLFIKKLNNGEVLDEAIVFIEDTKEIWNHGTYFDCSTTNFEEILNNYIDKATAQNYVDKTTGQTISGLKTFTNHINIANRSRIRSNIDPGELKVTRNDNDKGFIVRVNKDSQDSILPLEILSTNGQSSYKYSFPLTSGNVAVGAKLGDTTFPVNLSDGLIDLGDNFIRGARINETESTIMKHGMLNLGYGFIKAEDITYSELKTRLASKNLVTGQHYRIIDYVTTTAGEGTISAGKGFDLIVTALSEDSLDENAKACYPKENSLSGASQVGIFPIKTGNFNPMSWAVVENTTEMMAGKISNYEIENNISFGNYSICGDGYSLSVTGGTARIILAQGGSNVNLYCAGIEVFESKSSTEILTANYGLRKINANETTIVSYVIPGLEKNKEYFFKILFIKPENHAGTTNINCEIYDYTEPYYIGIDMSKWIIKYDINNDLSKYSWADTENGKGVIFYLKDEWDNECWYDFKNIKFKRTKEFIDEHEYLRVNDETKFTEDEKYFFTFDCNGNDDSLNTGKYKCEQNSLGKYMSGKKITLNNTIFLGNGNSNNKLGENNFNNIFGYDTYNNVIGVNCQGNIIPKKFTYNNIRNGFKNNTYLGDNFRYNEIGHLFEGNTVVGYTSRCNFGYNFKNNTIGGSVYDSIFGNNITSCKFKSSIGHSHIKGTMGNVINIPELYKVNIEPYTLYSTEEALDLDIITDKDGVILSTAISNITEDGSVLEDIITLSKTDNGEYYTHKNSEIKSNIRTLESSVNQKANKTDLNNYVSQDSLSSNFKTINGNSILGSGNVEVGEIKWLISDVGDYNNNATCRGYVGTLKNLNVYGDSVIINSISNISGSTKTDNVNGTLVQCKLLKFVNNAWETIYQSPITTAMSQTEGVETTFKMELIEGKNPIIKTSDKIAIIYINPDDDSEVILRFKTISKSGGLQNALATNSTGASNWCPYIQFTYFPTTSDTTVDLTSEQIITAQKQFNSGLSIAGKSLISSGIDAGEIKVFPQGSNTNKGFIIRSANRGDTIPTVEILGTNTSQSYNYQFPKKSGTVALTNDVPTSLKNPTSLTFGTKSYDGSSAQEITASDLGLSTALKYCGITTTELTDGATTNPIVIDNQNHTATTGCVVFVKDTDEEYVFNGNKWQKLGYHLDLSDYAKTSDVEKTYQPKGNYLEYTISDESLPKEVAINGFDDIYVERITVDHLAFKDGFGNLTPTSDGAYLQFGGDVLLSEDNYSNYVYTKEEVDNKIENPQISKIDFSNGYTLMPTSNGNSLQYDGCVILDDVNFTNFVYSKDESDEKYKPKQTAKTSPTASGNATAFIDTIYQDADGVITATKKTLPVFLTGGSQTTTSSASGGNNIYTFTKSDGTTSTLTVKNGSKGSDGNDGTNGTDGYNVLTSSASPTGTGASVSITKSTISNYSNAKSGDIVICANGNVYQLTTVGSSLTTWYGSYKFNIKGPQGDSASGDYIPMTGSNTIKGTLEPNSTNAYDLGATSYRWNNIYGNNIYASTAFYQSSDALKKNIVSDISLNIEDIANAPSVKFTWKHDSSQQSVGTIAQYWKKILPEIVKGEEGNYSVDYATLATINSISLAKKVIEQEARIAALETELQNIKQYIKM